MQCSLLALHASWGSAAWQRAASCSAPRPARLQRDFAGKVGGDQCARLGHRRLPLHQLNHLGPGRN